jgi:hypothetical protein
MNPGPPLEIILNERQKAILRILSDAGLTKGGRRTDGSPFAGAPAGPLAMTLDLVLSRAATEQDLVDILSWGNRELHERFRPVAKSLMTLYEPPARPEFSDPAVQIGLDALRRDLVTTGHADRLAWVDLEAANAARFFDDPAELLSKVVEDVQQRLQDEFVDTTWPACPRHPNHPLECGDGIWNCPRGGAVARLGELQRVGLQ